MLLVSFFTWWYGKGWLQVIHNMPARIHGVSAAFSVGQLMRTLFAPWRRIMSYPGASLQDKFHAWVDNTFSRVIGFVVRIIVLIAALLSILIVAVASVIEIILWPLLPLAVPGGLIAGVIL